MLDIDEAPEIGSAEAAVRSCVSLMAAVMGQREELLAYWLDLYYQVRLAYERENAAEPDPTVLRRGDLYPVLRELMQDALKSAVRGEAKDRMERKRAKEEGSGPPRAEQAGNASHECPRVALAPTGEGENEDAGAEPAPPSESMLSGFAPVDMTPDRGGWKRKKAAIRDRLLRARAEGVTFPELEQAGDVTFEEMTAIVNAAKADMAVYRRVEAALDALGK